MAAMPVAFYRVCGFHWNDSKAILLSVYRLCCYVRCQVLISSKSRFNDVMLTLSYGLTVFSLSGYLTPIAVECVLSDRFFGSFVCLLPKA